MHAVIELSPLCLCTYVYSGGDCVWFDCYSILKVLYCKNVKEESNVRQQESHCQPSSNQVKIIMDFLRMRVVTSLLAFLLSLVQYLFMYMSVLLCN